MTSFEHFPEARGKLGRIIAAHSHGELTDEEVCRLLLEEATGKTGEALHEEVTSRFASRRQRGVDLNDEPAEFLRWMVEVKKLNPDTARQYANRFTRVSSLPELLADGPNKDQRRATFRLLGEFYENR